MTIPKSFGNLIDESLNSVEKRSPPPKPKKKQSNPKKKQVRVNKANSSKFSLPRKGLIGLGLVSTAVGLWGKYGH